MADAVGLLVAVFVASAVEVVEAFTIVLAMGMSRGFGSALAGAGAALATLVALTAGLGISLREHIDASLLQLVVGVLLLVFGLQWLRKAVLRSSGLKALHDEEEIFAAQTGAAGAAASVRHWGIDGFGFVVSFKGVLLEGVEVVFIVLTFGLGAAHRGLPCALWIASLGAAAAAVAVIGAGVVIRRPLARLPENTMKHLVGLLLSSFGLFWMVEGLGVFTVSGESVVWPGGTGALGGIFLGWLLWSQVMIRFLRRQQGRARNPAGTAAT